MAFITCVFLPKILKPTENTSKPLFTAATMGRISDLEFAYYDTRALLGCMFEVVTRTQSFEERYQEIANSSENWDGENPIR